jgi:hypothetical protein
MTISDKVRTAGRASHRDRQRILEGNAERTGPVKYDKPIEMPRRVPDIVGDPHPCGRVDTG